MHKYIQICTNKIIIHPLSNENVDLSLTDLMRNSGVISATSLRCSITNKLKSKLKQNKEIIITLKNNCYECMQFAEK